MSISQQVKALEDRIKFLEDSLASERKKGYRDALRHFEVKTKFVVDEFADVMMVMLRVNPAPAHETAGALWGVMHKRMIEDSK
jgi:hypothetical protein